MSEAETGDIQQQQQQQIGPDPNAALYQELAERLAKREHQYPIQDKPINTLSSLVRARTLQALGIEAPRPPPRRRVTPPVVVPRHTPPLVPNRSPVNSLTRLVDEIPNEGALSSFLEPLSDIDKEFESIQNLADKRSPTIANNNMAQNDAGPNQILTYVPIRRRSMTSPDYNALKEKKKAIVAAANKERLLDAAAEVFLPPLKSPTYFPTKASKERLINDAAAAAAAAEVYLPPLKSPTYFPTKASKERLLDAAAAAFVPSPPQQQQEVVQIPRALDLLAMVGGPGQAKGNAPVSKEPGLPGGLFDDLGLSPAPAHVGFGKAKDPILKGREEFFKTAELAQKRANYAAEGRGIHSLNRLPRPFNDVFAEENKWMQQGAEGRGISPHLQQAIKAYASHGLKPPAIRNAPAAIRNAPAAHKPQAPIEGLPIKQFIKEIKEYKKLFVGKIKSSWFKASDSKEELMKEMMTTIVKGLGGVNGVDLRRYEDVSPGVRAAMADLEQSIATALENKLNPKEKPVKKAKKVKAMVAEAEQVVATAPRKRRVGRSKSKSPAPKKKRKTAPKKSKSRSKTPTKKKVSFKKAAKSKKKKSPAVACASSPTPWDLKNSDMHGEDLANPEYVMENGEPVAKMNKGAEWHLYKFKNKGDKRKLLMWGQPEKPIREGTKVFPDYSLHEIIVPANKQVTIKDAKNAKAIKLRSSDPKLSLFDKNRGKKFFTVGRPKHKAQTRKVSVSKAPGRRVTILKKDQPVAQVREEQVCAIEKKIKKKGGKKRVGRPKKK